MRAVVACFAMCSPAAAAMFSNGSFELPVISPGSHVMFDGNPIGPWTVSRPAGNMVEFVRGTHVGLAPYDGAQYVTFNGFNLNPGGGVFQDFDTVAATTYTVSFAVGRLGSEAGALAIEAAALSGVNVLSMLSASASATAGTWTTHSFQFTATGSSTRLRFTDASAATLSMDVALDGVMVVPAPGITAAIACAGMGMAARGRRRDRRSIPGCD